MKNKFFFFSVFLFVMFFHAPGYAQRFKPALAEEAIMKADQGRYGDAIMTLDCLLVLYPDYTSLLALKGAYQLCTKEHDEGLKNIARAIADSAGLPFPYFTRAHYFNMALPDSSARDYQRAAERVDPKSDSLLYLYISREWSSQRMFHDDTSTAFVIARKYLHQLPNSCAASCQLGFLYMRCGKVDSAEYYYRLAIQQNGQDAEGYSGLGAIMATRKDFDKAIPLLEKSMGMDSTSSSTCNTLGYCLIQAGKYKEALPFVEKALRENSFNAYALNNRGYIYLQMKKYTDALRDVNGSLKIMPQNAYAYRNRGLINMALGLKETACQDFNEALRLNFTQLYGDEVEKLVLQYCLPPGDKKKKK